MAQKVAQIRPQGYFPDRIPDGSFWSRTERSADRNNYPTVVAQDDANTATLGVINQPLYGIHLTRTGGASIGMSAKDHFILSLDTTGSFTRLYTVRGITSTEITPAAGLPGAITQNISTGGTLNNQVFIARLSAPPMEYIYGGTGLATTLRGWFGATVSCGAIRSFRDFLIVMDIFDSAGSVRLADEFRWSDRAVAGDLPTVWTAAATNEAGSASTGDSPSPIIDGQQLGDVFMMYKPQSAYRIEEIGLPQVMGKRKVLSQEGIMARNCIQNVGNLQLVVGHNDVYQTDGRQAQSIMDTATRRYFFDQLEATRRDHVFTAYNPKDREFWVCYPTDTFSRNIEALVWNGSRWHRRVIGSVGTSAGPSNAGYAHMYSGRDEDAANSQYPHSLYALKPDETSRQDRLQRIETDSVGAQTLLRVTGIQVVPGERTVIRRIYPITKNGGSWQFRIGFSDSPDPDDMDWTASLTAAFDPSTDDGIGVLSQSARYLGLEAQCSDIGAQLVGYDVVYETGGHQ